MQSIWRLRARNGNDTDHRNAGRVCGRFVSLEFDYPDVEAEADIIKHETGVDAQDAERLAIIGERVRNLKQHGFEEGVSTRLLIYAGELIAADIAPRRAAEVAIITAISDDSTVQQAVADIVDVILP